MSLNQSGLVRSPQSKQPGTADEDLLYRDSQSQMTDTTNIDHFSKLPAEMMVEIFSYLPTKSKLDGLCVSKLWHTNMLEPKVWSNLTLKGFSLTNNVTACEKALLSLGIHQAIRRAPQYKTLHVELEIGQRASATITDTIYDYAFNRIKSLTLAFSTTHQGYKGPNLRGCVPDLHCLEELELRGRCVDYLLWEVRTRKVMWEAETITLPASLKKLKLLGMEWKTSGYGTIPWNIRGSIEELEFSGDHIWMTDLEAFATTLQILKISNAWFDYDGPSNAHLDDRSVSLDKLKQLRELWFTNVKMCVAGPLPGTLQTLAIKKCHVVNDFTGDRISLHDWTKVLCRNPKRTAFPVITKGERYIWEAVDGQLRQATGEENDEGPVIGAAEEPSDE